MFIIPNETVMFKLAFTATWHYITIDPNWSCKQFVETMTPLLATCFHLSNLEIVETGYIDRPEDAPTFVPHENVLLRNKIDSFTHLVIYVRPKIDGPQSFGGECGVCLETTNVSRWFGCSHTFCGECYQGCMHIEHTSCPVCRQSPNEHWVRWRIDRNPDNNMVETFAPSINNLIN